MRGIDGVERAGQTVDGSRIVSRKIAGCSSLNLSDWIAQGSELAKRPIDDRCTDIQRCRSIQRVRGIGQLAQSVDNCEAGERRKISRQKKARLKWFDDEKMLVTGEPLRQIPMPRPALAARGT